MSAAELADSLAFQPLYLGSWNKQGDIHGVEPSPRRCHSTIYHKSSLYMYGGVFREQDNINQHRTIYRYNIPTKTWSKTVTNFLNNISFSHIYAHATIIYNNMMYLFGGTNYQTNTHVLGLWCLNLESYNWKRQELKGYSPPPRDHAAMILYQRSMIILYGGRTNGSNLNDLHIYRIENKMWVQIDQTSYDFRISCRLKPAFVSVGDHIYLFGGERQVSDGFGTTNVLLNDFYQLRLLYRPMSTRPDVWIKQIITNLVPSPRVACFASVADKYLVLWGGDNTIQDQRVKESGFWLYNINEVSWSPVKLKGNVNNLPQYGYTFTNGLEKFYIFGFTESVNSSQISSSLKPRTPGLQHFSLQVKQIESRFMQGRTQPKLTEQLSQISCNDCSEYSKMLARVKFSEFSILRQMLQQKLQYVFSAFGLLVDNCLLLHAKDCKIVFHHNFKEKYCLIEDNGNSQYLWSDHHDFITDLVVFRTYVEENIDQLEQIKDEEKIKTNFMKEEKDNNAPPPPPQNSAKETKQQKELKDKEAKEKEEERELRRRKEEAKRAHRKRIQDRKQFSRNIKLGSLRIGDRVIYISKFGTNTEHRRVFVIQKCDSSQSVLCYRAYYYILQNNAVIDPSMQSSKKYIDEEYKMYFKIAQQRKDTANNFLFVTNLHDIINEGGQIEPELKESTRHNDVFCCEKRQLESLEDGVLLQSIDFSLKNYLSLLYLKSDELKMSLTISEHRTVQISNLQIFDKIDALVKTQKIIDLQKPLDLSNCNIIEVYYNKVTSSSRARDLNRKTNSFNFLNGILFYHCNRLISRYKFNLGEVNRLFRNKVKNIQQSLIMFGFIEIKDQFTVNIFKTGFVRDDLLEEIYHRLKFVEKYACRVSKQQQVRSRPLDERGDRNQPRKRSKGDENNDLSNPANNNNQIINID